MVKMSSPRINILVVAGCEVTLVFGFLNNGAHLFCRLGGVACSCLALSLPGSAPSPSWRRSPRPTRRLSLHSCDLDRSCLTLFALCCCAVGSDVASSSQFEGACLAKPWILAIGFTMAFGGLFARTFRVHRIFNVPFSLPAFGVPPCVLWRTASACWLLCSCRG